MNLLDLPECMLEQIFEYLPYDEIAKKRLISVQINKICQRLLNVGFQKMMKRHTFNLKKIKSLLPRRESERRNHALAKHADILTCIETRISMLSMTYTKYIDLNLCCFIPGKIIDEVHQVLKLVDTSNKPLRAHEVLQELRDISSMAIDHFDEKIAPVLKKSFCDISSQKFGSTIYQIMQGPIESSSLLIQSTADFGSELLQDRGMLEEELPKCRDAQTNSYAILRIDQKYNNIMKKLNRTIQLQNKQLRQTRNHALQISELKTQMHEFRRRLEESTSKSNISQIASIDGSATTATATTTTPTTPDCNNGPSSSNAITPSTTLNSSNYIQNIKPRTATIILKRRFDDEQSNTTATSSPNKKQLLD